MEIWNMEMEKIKLSPKNTQMKQEQHKCVRADIQKETSEAETSWVDKQHSSQMRFKPEKTFQRFHQIPTHPPASCDL